MMEIKVIAMLLAIGLCSSCGGKGPDTTQSSTIDKAFWGHWTDASTGAPWYVSDKTVTDSAGTLLTVQEASASSIVVFAGSTQYRINAGTTGMLSVAGAGSLNTTLYKRNGSDAPFSATLKSQGGSKALVAAGGIGLVLQNILNNSNRIQTTSSAAGEVVIPPNAIAGDDYRIYLGAGGTISVATPVSVVHVSAPDENAGTISLPPPGLGYTFKVSIKDSGPLDFRYPDGQAHAVTLVIENVGSKDATDLAYSLAPSDPALTVAPLSGAALSGSIGSLAKGASKEVSLNVSLGAGASFSDQDYIEPGVAATIVAGGETWTDRATLRFYREKRFIKFADMYSFRGFIRSPDGVAMHVSLGKKGSYDYLLTIALPYRSKPYELFLFPDYSYAIRPSGDGPLQVLYAGILSQGQVEPTDATPAPLYSAYEQGNFKVYVGPSYGGGSGLPETWYNPKKLNDGNEPNETLGAGPVVYRGQSFHGYLTDNDYDAFTIDFSKDDPLAGTGDRANDFALRFPGSISDYVSPMYDANDWDGILEPGETGLAILDLKCRLDASTLDGWTAGLKTTTIGGASIAGNDGLSLTPPGYGDLKQLFASYDTSKANLTYADDRVLGYLVAIPANATPRPQCLIDKRLRVTVSIYDASSQLYGEYSCEIPIAAP